MAKFILLFLIVSCASKTKPQEINPTEFDDVDFEMVLADQKVKRKVIKGKPRFIYTKGINHE